MKKKPGSTSKKTVSNSKPKPDVIKIAQALKVVKRANASKKYLDYVTYTNPGYEHMRYNDLIIDAIQSALDAQEQMKAGALPKQSQYLMISVPPRHGKSMTVSETLLSYVMGKYPKYKGILTAYSSTLAEDFSKANSRKTIEYNVFNVKVKSDNQDRTEYSNGSVCVKAGIMGGINGKGANLLLIDDPVKTSEEAHSETYREKMWKEWESSLSTRLEPPAIVILIMTRWHEDDLAGRLLNPEYGKPLPWKVINLPLEAEDNDILGREPGEPLWPERYGLDFIEERKQYPQSFNALYQGRPTSQEGNIIKRHWFKWYQRTPEFIDSLPALIMSVDATYKDTSKSDSVSIQVWGKKAADYYLVDRINARMDFVTTIQAIKNMLMKYPKIHAKLIEDKANGSAIISQLNRDIGGFIGVNPQGSKEARVHSVLPYYESGNVYLPNGESWTGEFVEQLTSFPVAAHDDDVDAMSQALARLIRMDASIKPEEDPDVLSYQQKVHKSYGSGKHARALTKWG